MMKWIRNLFFFIIAVLFIAFLFNNTSKINEDEYKENISKFNETKDSYAKIDVLVYEYRNSSLFNYDEINKIQIEIDKGFSFLVSNLFKKNIPNIDKELEKHFQNKFAYYGLIDRFKFVNSIYHNSYNYIPIILFRINKKFENHSKQDFVQEIVNNIIGEVHRATALGDFEAFATLTSLEQILSRNIKKLSKDNWYLAKELRFHIRKLQESISQREGLIDIIVDSKWVSTLTSSRTFYEDYFQLKVKHVKFYQKILIIFSVLLSMYVIFLMYKWNELSSFLDNIFEHMNDWLFVTNAKGSVLSVNKQASNCLEMEQEAATGKSLSSLIEFRHKKKNITKEIITAQKPFYYSDIEMHRGDDQHQIPISISGAPIFKSNGKTNEVVIVARDISEVRTIQNEKLQLINEMNKSKNSALVGEMAGRTAHEILNPLTEFNIKLELIVDNNKEIEKHLEKDKDLLAENSQFCKDLQVAVHDITEKVTHMKKLIPTESKLKKINLLEVIESIESLTKLQRDRHEIEMVNEVDSDVICLGNEMNIIQVLHGLIENSIQAMITNEKTGKGKITLRIGESDSGVSLLISDNGPGVSQDKVSMLFEAGYSQQDKNPGLGLSLGRRLMRNIGGDLKVYETKLGQGIIFELKFKANEQ